MWITLLLLTILEQSYAKTPDVKQGTKIKRAPTQTIASNFPFLQEFQQEETLEQKLILLKKWNHEIAKKNDTSYYTFESLVRLNILGHVHEGVLDCKGIHDKLTKYLYRRYDIDDNAYIMFNEVVDDLCPPHQNQLPSD